MTKRKHQTKMEKEVVSFHKDFREPTASDRNEALGSFPLDIPPAHPCESPRDLDDDALYRPIRKKIKAPNFELDWLSQVPEEGQTLQDYVRLLRSRQGRLRPIANIKGNTICLLPMVRESQWPTSQDGSAPDLELLQTLTSAYFCRPVKILRPARLSTVVAYPSTQDGDKKRKNQKDAFFVEFFNDQGVSVLKRAIQGRYHRNTGRSQYKVTSVLTELSCFREDCCQRQENFCIMGVTMEDLYDGDSDIFCAGMAFGGGKVACFSLFRYHPTIRMNTLTWWDYGFQSRPGNDSYFVAGKRPKGLRSHLPDKLSVVGQQEYLRRSIKLLVHELGHLFGLDHCIYYTCLMMGTGHLVEDFEAPMQLCGICLRKLQWRLGFSVEGRYEDLMKRLKEIGLTSQANWIRRQLSSIQRARKLRDTSHECILIDD